MDSSDLPPQVMDIHYRFFGCIVNNYLAPFFRELILSKYSPSLTPQNSALHAPYGPKQRTAFSTRAYSLPKAAPPSRGL
jgi:hypothetical protein